MATKNELDAMLERLRTGGNPNDEKPLQPPTTPHPLSENKQDNANYPESDPSSTASSNTANLDSSAEMNDNSGDDPKAAHRAKKSKNRKNKRNNPAKSTNPEARNSDRKGIVAALENILDEDPDSLARERSEKAEPDTPQDSARKNRSPKLKQRIYAIFGVLFSIFAVIGFITVCKAGFDYFHRFTSGEEKRSDFIDIINPAVVMDINEFSTPSELESDQLITSAIWALIMNSDNLDKYNRTFDVISVPEIDVEACAAQLFGSSIPKISHQTVGSGELKFYYDEANKSYNVPVNPISFSYIPEIESIAKDGAEYTLIVNYMSELPSWMEDSPNFERDASKIVEYKLVESGDSYTISSVRVITVNSII